MNRYFLVGILAITLSGCSTTNNSILTANPGKTFIASSDPAPCTISASYKTPACYVTESQSGNIVITNEKPSCKKNAACLIPACSVVIHTLPSGKIVREEIPCAS